MTVSFSACSDDDGDDDANSPIAPPAWTQGVWKAQPYQTMYTTTVTSTNVILESTNGDLKTTYNILNSWKEKRYTSIEETENTSTTYTIKVTGPSVFEGESDGAMFFEFEKKSDTQLLINGILYDKQ